MTTRRIERIPVARIFEDMIQLRSDYDEEPLRELGDSVADEGLLQPIVVAPLENENFELIIGSRRLRAVKQQQLEEIDAVIIEERSPLNYLVMALSENLHRQDLNAFEEARAFLRLMKDYGLGVEQVAEKVRKGTQYVTARIQLLSLPEEVQNLIANKALGLNVVGVLAKLATGGEQVEYANKAAAERLNPAELRALINREEGVSIAPRSTGVQMSAEKVRVRVDMFTSWLKKLPRKTAIKKLNASERGIIGAALYALEVEIRTLRHLFTGKTSEPSTRPASSGNGNIEAFPRNAGVEWPAGDIRKIMAEDRPSDPELSRMLGRSVAAIKSMRSVMKAKRKAG